MSQPDALPLVLVALGDEAVSALEAGLAEVATQPRDLVVLSDQAPPDAFDPILASHTLWIEAQGCPAPEHYWCWLVASLPVDLGRVLVWRAGTVLPPNGLARLESAALQSAAMVFPLSARHWLSRAFLEENASPTLDAQNVDRWCNRYHQQLHLELPLTAGYSAAIDLQACRAITATDDTALATGLRLQGATLALSDAVYVDDSAHPPAETRKGLPPAVLEAFDTRHPLTALRHPLSELDSRAEKPDATVPFSQAAILHISHSWGGGLARWIEDFAAGDHKRTHWVLRSIGDWDAASKSLALFRVGADSVPVKRWTLTTPIVSTAVGHGEYRQILGEIAAHLPLSRVVVSTLIGHSMDLYDLPLPVMQVLHDFYPWCPPLYATWGSPCNHCDRARLNQCLTGNPAHRFFRDESPGWLASMREAFVAHVIRREIPLVVPSASVRQRWHQLAPALAEHPMAVIGHGLDVGMLKAFAEHRSAPIAEQQRPLQLLVLGSAAPHKGGDLLEAAMPELLALGEVTLLGCGTEDMPVTERDGVRFIASYNREELPAILASLQPDVALLLSVVPETFSYTLSELQAAAVPTVATRIGAFADRIESGRTGWLIEPNAVSLTAQLRALSEDRACIATVRAQLADLPTRSLEHMVADYDALLPHAPTAQFRPRWPLPGEQRLDTPTRLHVHHEATYGQALGSFMDFTLERLAQTPRVAGSTRRLLTGLLSWLRQRLPD